MPDDLVLNHLFGIQWFSCFCFVSHKHSLTLSTTASTWIWCCWCATHILSVNNSTFLRANMYVYLYMQCCIYIHMQWYIYIYVQYIYIYICNESKNVRTTKTCGKMRHPIVPRGAVTCAGAIRLSYQVVVLILTVFINQSIQQLGRITTCSLWHLPWITVWVLAAHYTKPYRELSNHTDTHGRSTVRRFHTGELPPHGTRDKEGCAVDATARGKPNLYTYSISAHTVL